MKRIKVSVTKTHIEDGDDGCPYGCAIALALNDVFNTKTSVIHDSFRFYNLIINSKLVYLSKRVCRFIKTFDKDKDKCKPFKFIINVPPTLTKYLKETK